MQEHWPQRWDVGRQRVHNSLPVPARFFDARHGPIPVTARVEWERDGLEQIETRATGWTSAAVLVDLYDRRAEIIGVWLIPGDVRRR